jgi:flagellar motor component MotA
MDTDAIDQASEPGGMLAPVLLIVAGLLALGASWLLLRNFDQFLILGGASDGAIVVGAPAASFAGAMALLGGLFVALAVALRFWPRPGA